MTDKIKNKCYVGIRGIYTTIFSLIDCNIDWIRTTDLWVAKVKPLWPLSPKWTIFCCTDVRCNSWKVCYATILRIKVSSHWVNNLRGPEVRNNWGWRELLPDCWQWRLFGWNYFLLLRSNNDFSSYTSRPKRLGLFTKQILVIIR